MTIAELRELIKDRDPDAVISAEVYVPGNRIESTALIDGARANDLCGSKSLILKIDIREYD